MDNLADILSRKNIQESPEIKIIKDFVMKNYNETVNIKVDLNKIIIFVNSSGLASNLRMNIPEIQRICSTDKRIAIYIKS